MRGILKQGRTKFYQDGDDGFNITDATMSLNDGVELYFSIYPLDRQEDVRKVMYDFMTNHDGDARLTVLNSKSRKYPNGTEIDIKYNDVWRILYQGKR